MLKYEEPKLEEAISFFNHAGYLPMHLLNYKTYVKPTYFDDGTFIIEKLGSNERITSTKLKGNLDEYIYFLVGQILLGYLREYDDLSFVTVGSLNHNIEFVVRKCDQEVWQKIYRKMHLDAVSALGAIRI